MEYKSSVSHQIFSLPRQLEKNNITASDIKLHIKTNNEKIVWRTKYANDDI